MADVESRTLGIRNPRTGAIDFQLRIATAEEVAAKAARLRENQKMWAARPVGVVIGLLCCWD
jgi:acyl-CoA reductase-like NAD-dependent aldehyde dehydrogenase